MILAGKTPMYSKNILLQCHFVQYESTSTGLGLNLGLRDKTGFILICLLLGLSKVLILHSLFVCTEPFSASNCQSMPPK